MTEPELIEKIAEEGVHLYNFPNLWKRLNKSEKDYWRHWAKTRILPIIEKVGYIKLSEDQRLPSCIVQELCEAYRKGWESLPVNKSIPGDIDLDVRGEAGLSEVGKLIDNKYAKAGWQKVEVKNGS